MSTRAGIAPLLGAALLTAAPAGASAAGPEEVRRAIEAAYGVQVLDVARVERGKRRLFAVRVLTPGAPHNDAWQVNELLVDAQSGRLVPAFQHEASGYAFEGPRTAPAPQAEGEKLIRVPLPPFGRSVPVIDRAGAAAPGKRGTTSR